MLILGIDTSNYTSSIALVDGQANLLVDNRRLLTVKEGERGLRQSDALFQHVMNIPDLFEDFSHFLGNKGIKIVSASNKPRPLKDSYMPVFRASQSFGRTIAQILNCPYMEFSHQENHIEAAKWSIKDSLKNEFLAVHLSGGTTEILHVIDQQKAGYNIKIIGGTSDISAGQFIDRVGVKLGFKFPSGKYMDDLVSHADRGNLVLPSSVKDTTMSFSGPETMVQRLIESNHNPVEISQAVFKCIDRSLQKAIVHACKTTLLRQVLFMGGVSSSRYIRESLIQALSRQGITAYFADPKYCTDNAVGTALLPIKN